MIIDFHTHIFPPWVRENRAEYLKQDRGFAELYSSPKAKMATVEDLIDSMDRDEIDVSIVLNSGWANHQLCVETNEYIMESVSRYPDRLVGFCALQPKSGELALAELERCARNGIKGIGELMPDSQGFDLRDKELMAPLAHLAMQHNMPILTHTSEPVGHIYSGKGNVTPERVYQFITDFPKLQIICAHWGGGLPFYALMPEVASALSNTFFDTAATPFLYRYQIFSQVINLVGEDKVLFGSDYPLISQRRIISELESIYLPESTKGKLLGGNAARLLRWKESAVS